MSPSHPSILDALRVAIRTRRYSRRTERAYWHWVEHFLAHPGDREPQDLGSEEVNDFLSHLAVDQRVAAPTRSQARAALMFLFRHVFRSPLDTEVGGGSIVRARVPRRLPVVLTRPEVRALLASMSPPGRIVALLLYGGGLRLNEALHLRVHDPDAERGQLTVRVGKGDRDRITLYPRAAVPEVEEQLRRTRRMHERDLARGAGNVPLPAALARKYPGAPREWGWQWVFPASRLHHSHRTGAGFRRARGSKPSRRIVTIPASR